MKRPDYDATLHRDTRKHMPHRFQLLTMQFCQAGERLLAFICQENEHLTAIFFPALPAHQTEPDGAIDQPHDTVLAHL